MIFTVYIGTSLYVLGRYMTVLSIYRYIKVYVGISRYMRVLVLLERTKHFDKMCMTLGFET